MLKPIQKFLLQYNYSNLNQGHQQNSVQIEWMKTVEINNSLISTK